VIREAARLEEIYYSLRSGMEQHRESKAPPVSRRAPLANCRFRDLLGRMLRGLMLVKFKCDVRLTFAAAEHFLF